MHRRDVSQIIISRVFCLSRYKVRRHSLKSQRVNISLWQRARSARLRSRVKSGKLKRGCQIVNPVCREYEPGVSMAALPRNSRLLLLRLDGTYLCDNEVSRPCPDNARHPRANLCKHLKPQGDTNRGASVIWCIADLSRFEESGGLGRKTEGGSC